MRVKEGSDDYRYFPEPDLVELYIDDEWKERVRASIPELPDERRKRYIDELDSCIRCNGTHADERNV